MYKNVLLEQAMSFSILLADEKPLGSLLSDLIWECEHLWEQILPVKSGKWTDNPKPGKVNDRFLEWEYLAQFRQLLMTAAQNWSVVQRKGIFRSRRRFSCTSSSSLWTLKVILKMTSPLEIFTSKLTLNYKI